MVQGHIKQSVFKQLVRDTTVKSDVTITITNMHRAIASCNRILNLAINHHIILVPTDVIIIKQRIDGNNDIIHMPTSEMVFGVSESLNFTVEATIQRKMH